MSLRLKFFFFTLSLLPITASAQGLSFQSLVSRLMGYVNDLIPIFIGIAFIVFIFSLAQYLAKGQDAKERGGLKNRIIAGVVGLFVVVAVWGLINLIGNIFGVL